MIGPYYFPMIVQIEFRTTLGTTIPVLIAKVDVGHLHFGVLVFPERNQIEGRNQSGSNRHNRDTDIHGILTFVEDTD